MEDYDNDAFMNDIYCSFMSKDGSVAIPTFIINPGSRDELVPGQLVICVGGVHLVYYDTRIWKPKDGLPTYRGPSDHAHFLMTPSVKRGEDLYPFCRENLTPLRENPGWPENPTFNGDIWMNASNPD